MPTDTELVSDSLSSSSRKMPADGWFVPRDGERSVWLKSSEVALRFLKISLHVAVAALIQSCSLPPSELRGEGAGRDGGSSVDQGVGDVGLGAPAPRGNSGCYAATVEPTRGFVEFEDENSQGRSYLLVTKPVQQGCLWTQGGVVLTITSYADDEIKPARRLRSVVWGCNTCKSNLSILFHVTNGLSWARDFSHDTLGPSDRTGITTWPLDATYDVTSVRDSVISFSLPDGTSFVGGCFWTDLPGGVRQLVIGPDESINMGWTNMRQGTVNPPEDKAEDWRAPKGAVLELAPSIFIGDNPRQIPELLPTVCEENGYDHGTSCSSHCVPDGLQSEGPCPYECPSEDAPVSIRTIVEHPYPEDLLFFEQAFN